MIQMKKQQLLNDSSLDYMCPKCEARAVKALEDIDGVEKAVASHTDKNAVVTLAKDVDNAELKKAVEEAGYEVVEIN